MQCADFLKRCSHLLSRSSAFGGGFTTMSVRAACCARRAYWDVPLCPPTSGLRRGVMRSCHFGGADLTSQIYCDAFDRFNLEIAKPDFLISLPYAAALLALHAEPEMDPESEVLTPLSHLCEEFRAYALTTVPPAAPLPDAIRLQALADALCTFLANKGFAGCEQDKYQEADNSLLNKVMARKIGIPISLSLVYQEVGRAGGLQLHGVNFPGHFLLSFGQDSSAGLLDAFSSRTLNRVQNANVWSVASCVSQYAPRVSNIAFLRRMVLNLENVYSEKEHMELIARISKYARALDDAAARVD